MEYLAQRNRFSLLQHHQGFGDSRPAPVERVHSKTWRHTDYDQDNLPITEQGASEMFGTAAPKEFNDTPVLNIWKHIADEKYKLFKKKKQDEEAARRAIALRNLQTLQDYIKERSQVLDRQQEQMKHLQEQEETRRLQQRQFEKQERRRQRWEQYLAKEREHMELEDRRSHAHRTYCEELLREQYERENMFNAECDQCEVDRFWGLDFFEAQLAAEEARLREFYQQRLKSLNKELRRMGCVKSVPSFEIRPIGSLPDESPYLEAPRKKKEHKQADDEEAEIDLELQKAQERARKLYIIKKLKAEEVRSKLKYRMKTNFY